MTTAIEKIPVSTIDGNWSDLEAYHDKVRLVVNVASKCGLTPQYEGLEALHKKYADKGFTVLGFPANEFGGQEPGSNEEIKQFCSLTYGVTFPMFSKIVVKGQGQHPLYAALTQGKDIEWNFEKFLIDRAGNLIGRFSPQTKPEDPALVGAIERALDR